MNETSEPTPSRKCIAIRLLFTLLFLAIYCVLKFLLVVTTIFQFIYLLVTLKTNEPVRIFANKVVTLAYKVWRYVTLNDNQRPFPFSEFPGELEPPEAEVKF